MYCKKEDEKRDFRLVLEREGLIMRGGKEEGVKKEKVVGPSWKERRDIKVGLWSRGGRRARHVSATLELGDTCPVSVSVVE